MDSPGPPNTPESLFAEHLARLGHCRPSELEELCREQPEHAPALRKLAQEYERVQAVLALVGASRASKASFAERLSESVGTDVDPAISLDTPGPADDAPSSALVRRLREHSMKGMRYALQGEIARGGMGAILRVWDEDLRRHLAMKVILGKDDASAKGETPAVDSRQLARFLEEAQVTGQLDHPGIVPVHELGLDADGRVYFTMKLVKGRDLKQVFELVFAGEEDWNETRALGVVLKVCEAMAYAHTKGVIHRDLKPANVMVGHFGEVYVMDWGLARVLGRKDSHDLRLRPAAGATSVQSVRTERREEREDAPDSPIVTMDGDVMGTPAYMPPEQARGEIEHLGPPSDVYAIGAILYHLLARQMPYVARGERLTNHTVLARVLDGPPKPLTSLRKDVPGELISICEKAMARDRAARYPDTLALAADLRAYLEGRVVSAHATGAVAELRKWVKRNRGLAASALVTVLVAMAGLAWVANERVRRASVELEKEALERDKQALELLGAGMRIEGLTEAAEQFWPVTDVQHLPAMEEWIREANELTRPEFLAAVQRELEEVSRQGRRRSPEEVARLVEVDPRHREVLEKREQVEFRKTVLARWQGGDPEEPDSMKRMPDWALFPTEPLRLNELAWKYVGFERDGEGNEPLALRLVERAMESVPPENEIEVEDTLAWAYFRNGLVDEARETVGRLREKAERAPQGLRDAVLGSVKKLEEELNKLDKKGSLSGYQLDTERMAEEADELERAMTAELEWKYSSFAATKRNRYFAKLPTELESFSASARSRAKFGMPVQERAEWARTLAEKSVASQAARAAWEQAIASIRDRNTCPKYDGLVIEPQVGLLPLGRDERSGLWEFLHVVTGTAPARGADGRFVVEDETGVLLVLLPGGKFRMGAQGTDPTGDRYLPEAPQDESPIVEIELAPYFFAKHELTQGQWMRIAGRNPSFLRAGIPRGGTTVSLAHPVEGIAWVDANKWLGRMGLALPTEAQWECAARAGQEETVHTGDAQDTLDGAANVRDRTLQDNPQLGQSEQPFLEDVIDGFVIHAPVGRFRPNDFGLHDTIGNVWEWCRDRAGPYNQPPLPGDGERLPYGLTNRVMRGGSYLEDATDNRLSRRNEDVPGYRVLNLGVRAARVVEGQITRDK